MKRVTGVLLIFLAAALPPCAAVVLTWSGATGGSFSTGTNWVGNTVPASGDAVEFTSTVTNTTVSFTGPGTTTVGNITFSGTSRPSYSFGGTGSPTLSLAGDFTVSSPGDVTFASTLTVNLANNSLGNTFSIASGATVTIAGTISGAVGITKTGAGTLVLTGTNTYTDPTRVNEGILSVSTLGTASGASSLGNDNGISDYLFVRLGNLTTTGTLRYTGNANVSTNRGIDMAGTTGGATLDASGTGAVTYSSFRVTGAGAKTLTLTGDSNAANTLSAVVPDSSSGATSLVKNGTGTWTLSGANTYSGGTTLSAGRIIAGNNAAFGTSGVSMTGGATLAVASGKTVSNTLTFSGSSANVLGGTGTFSSAVTTNSTVVLSPGDSIGTLNFSNGLTIGTGSAISFQIHDASGTAGTGYDLINVSGGLLALTATANTITFNIVSVNSSGGGAAAINFNAAQSYAWTFATMASSANSGTITGFNSNLFNLVPSEFTNSLAGGTFSFSLSNDQRSLLLNFTPVPEPSTYVLMGTGLSLLAGAAWRRRRS